MVSLKTSTRSGSLTVLAQPRCSLWPCSMNGDPGKKPPATCQPSPLSRTASYQATGPVYGWCELTNRRVAPSAERDGATATALEPTGNELSVNKKAFVWLRAVALSEVLKFRNVLASP